MFDKTAKYYDQIYSFKDYADESRKIDKVIQNECPEAKTLLDVGCGTGEHVRCLGWKYSADGIDIEPELVEIAQNKIPASKFSVADMRSFRLERRYDVVQCLFSSIGYLTDPDDVVRALRNFASHLNENGVVIVEPWLTPDSWGLGDVYMKNYESGDSKICRMNNSKRVNTITTLYFHYLIGEKSGIQYLQEEHVLRLYTVDQMMEFFASAEMDVKYDSEGIFGRGLYVGRKKLR